VINVLELPTYKKRVRKVSEQAENESRRLWYNVTQALKIGDIDSATKYKQTVSSLSISLSLCAHMLGVSPHWYISRTVWENICRINCQLLDVQMLPPTVFMTNK
jgi:hypothetical protein